MAQPIWSARRALLALVAGVALLAAAVPPAPAHASVTYAVNSTADKSQAQGSVGCTDPALECTLRAAVQAGNGQPGGTVVQIVLGPGTYPLTIAGGGGANQGDLNVTGNRTLAITGAGANATTIDASALGNRIFEAASIEFTLRDLAIVGGGTSGNGGALSIRRSTLTLERTRFGGNSATAGGAVYAQETTTTVVDSTFAGNTASAQGGALAIVSGEEAGVTVHRSTFSGNSAGTGGGAVDVGGAGPVTAVVENSTLDGNTAGGAGGSLRLGGGASASLVHATISGGSATAGSAVHADGPVTVRGTILHNPGAAAECAGAGGFTSTGNNLGRDASCGLAAGSDDLVGADPLLRPLGDHGGLTHTRALELDSPAIDAAGETCPVATDQRGLARPQGDACDVGAYEHGAGTRRVPGVNRFDTAAKVSLETYEPGVGTVFVATGENFPDALTGGVAAALTPAPLLLVARDRVPDETVAELRRLQPGRVVVLGGTAAVGDGVFAELQGFTGGEVVRWRGPDRFGTAAEVSRQMFAPGVGVAYVATGLDHPDALSGSAVAAATHGPLLLVTGDAVPAATAEELQRLRPGRIVVLGGTAVVSAAVADALRGFTTGPVERRSGAHRYETAQRISESAFTRSPIVYVATGVDFPDALVGGSAAGRVPAPLLLVTRDAVPAATAAEITRLGPTNIVILGGLSAVGQAVEDELARLLAG